MKFFCVFIYLLLKVNAETEEEDFDPITSPLLIEHPCRDSNDIVTWFDPGLPAREKNRYYIIINRHFPADSVIQLSFDSDVNIMHRSRSANTTYNKIFLSSDESLTLRLVTETPGFGFIVKGVVPGTNPYFESITINGEEVCNQPNVGYLEEYIAETLDQGPQKHCGRRRVKHTELIVNGANTKPGDWPWHAAIFKLKRKLLEYICGGTLISKNYILSAAHCVTKNGIPIAPGIVNVVLGKYNLIGVDDGTQEKAVHKIIVHEKFNQRNILDNDISLLKLKSEAIFTNYVQPACLWFSNAKSYREGYVEPYQTLGTTIGWGFNSYNTLSSQLQQAKMPIISENACIKSYPEFYSKVLNGDKFCAGYRNGTSPCNGDSGSAFQVFVPDKTPDVNSNATGAWYVRGIVSLSVVSPDKRVCDPTQYTVFTNVEKYRQWIDAYLENEIN